MRIKPAQDADHRRRRGGIGDPQFSGADNADPGGNPLFYQLCTGNQQMFCIGIRHCRAFGDIAAAACQFQGNHVIDRIAVNADIHRQHAGAVAAGNRADAGQLFLNIAGLDSGDFLRGDGDTFCKYAVIRTHHNNFFRQIIRMVNPRHSGKMYRQIFQAAETARRLGQSVDMLLCRLHGRVIQRWDRTDQVFQCCHCFYAHIIFL